MRFVLSAMGTTGDIRPFVAIGMALRQLGHQSELVVPQNAEQLCQAYGLSYHLVDFDYRSMVQMIAAKPTTRQLIGVLAKEISAPFAVLPQVAEGADCLIGNVHNYAIQPTAEHLGLSYRLVSHTPQVLQSSDYPPWRFTRQSNPAWLNRLLWLASNLRENRIGQRFVNPERQKLGLPPVRDFAALYQQRLILVADQDLVRLTSGAKARCLQTDYWHLEDATSLSGDLLEFIRAGSPPLYFGFGSAPDMEASATVDMVEQLSQSLEARVIVQSGWAGLNREAVSERMMIIGNAPHQQLFPLMAGVVHHGGAGTTHTAALAGVPQLIVPQWGDQFYWGNRVACLGLGPQPVQKAQLSLARLQPAVTQLLKDGGLRERAARMGQTLARRASMPHIARQIEQMLCQGR